MERVAEVFQAQARDFKATADPLRLLILRVLRRQSYGVLELSRLLDVQQSRLSHHLKILTQARLVTQRREGNSIFYQRHPAPENWATSVFAVLDRSELPDSVAARREQIDRERQQSAEQFFARHADEFRQRQDLIAEYPQYGELASQLLQQQSARGQLAVEVGPGLGEFLPELSAAYANVWAVDISAELLTRARETLPESVSNVRFFHGDLNDWAQAHGSAPDLLVYNMVLHHIPDPGGELERAGRQLAEGGLLLVTELDRHQQSWARESCGDHWLGFAAEELNQWATAVGLQRISDTLSALRNGFQVQSLLFQKVAAARVA